MLDRLFHLIAHQSCRTPRTILAIGVALAVVCVVYAALQLRINADTDDLIASDRPFMHTYRAFLREFGDLEFLYVVVEATDDRARTEAAVDELAARLRAVEDIPAVFHAIEPEEQLRIATRAMSNEQLRGLSLAAEALSILQPDATPGLMLHQADRLLQSLIARAASMDADEQEQTLASAAFLLQALAASVPESSANRDLTYLLPEHQSRQYLRSDSGRFYFILLMPIKDYSTMSVIKGPLRRIRAAIDEVRTAFPEMEIGLTGRPVLQADEMRTTERDMMRASIIAVVLVTILFMVVIGGVWRPALAVIALGLGIAWTFGMATLVIGQLNLLSIVFTLVLVGVGIDFGVHMVARYREELANGGVEEAIERTLRTSGRGNMAGAITSSAAFFMAMFTDFQGLRELGFIAGSGLLLCLISMSVMLPALLAWHDRKRKPGTPVASVLTTALPESGHRIWSRVLARPGIVLIASAVLTAALLPGLWRLSFQNNLLELQARGLESVQWEHRILDDSAETWFGAVIVNDISEIAPVVARAEGKPSISSVQSIFDVVQPPSAEREQWRGRLHTDAATEDDDQPWNLAHLMDAIGRLRLIATGAEGEAPAEAAILQDLAGDLQRLHDQLTPADQRTAQHAVESLRMTVRAIAASIATLLEGDRMELHEAMPRAIRSRFLSEQGRYLVTLHPRENVWEYEPMQDFVRDMRLVDADATGVPITQFESLNEMRQGFQRAALLAFAAVFVIVLLDLRSLRYALYAVLPLLVSMLWLAAGMGIAGLQFTLANFFAVPILIGIGIDGAIHIIRRYREGAGLDLQLGSTRRAVFMTMMTTMIGFGCLMFASHRGLQGLGLVMFMGSLAGLLTTLLLLPALLALFDIRRRHAADT